MNPLKALLRYCNSNVSRKFKAKNRKILSSLNINCSYCSSVFIEKSLQDEDDNFYSKIIYNEVLNSMPKKITKSKPIFLKYLTENKSTVKEKVEAEPDIINFPFKVREEVLPEIDIKANTAGDDAESSDKADIEEGTWKEVKYNIDINYLESPQKWNILPLIDEKIDNKVKFGTCDPNQPISEIPCGGCGAFFHCNDPSIPGFLPYEVFSLCKKNELLGKICQRCHFLKTFNVSLGVNVPPSQYEQIISTIRDKPGLVIFMVDLLDFPCSIYPKVFELIGPSKPVVVVGNKVDLLMLEDSSFLDNFKKSLLASLKECNFNTNNIKHVALISAKTGYGVEELISTLQSCWGDQGDIYLIGCTNVGKSSLFNTLIQSDLCKINAVDILQRATVSAWPGTTLNLLKFPITKPLSWRLAARQNRLAKEEKNKLALQRLQFCGQTVRFQQIPLMDSVGMTFQPDSNSQNSNDPEEIGYDEHSERKGLDPKLFHFAYSKWFYDTPGVVHEDQILHLLTASELLLTLPKKILAPRNFRLMRGQCLFIGGLARLDFIFGPDTAWFTVFASEELPITVTKIEDADLVYQKLLGTPLFRVPTTGEKRLSVWPKLASKKIEISKSSRYTSQEVDDSHDSYSDTMRDSTGDIVLSSAGWVSVYVTPPYRCIVEAWTPEGRGIHVRKVPIIKKGYTFRGERIKKTPAYKNVVKEVRGYTLKDKPPF